MIYQLFLSDYKPFSFKPIFFGFEDCSPGHSYSGFRNYYILHLIHKGRGTVYMEGKKRNLGAGEGFIIPPGVRNRYSASIREPWHYVWAAWEDPEGEMEERFSFSLNNPYIQVPQHLILDLVNILHSSNSNNSRKNSSAVWFSSLMHTLLEKYGKKSSEKTRKNKSTTEDYGKKMKEFIHKNYSTRINASDVADYINLERSYASHIFKKNFGTGIYRYISEIRYEKACELLKESYSAKEVCFSCGYSDYHNFLKTFKKTSGFSPTEYRKLRIN